MKRIAHINRESTTIQDRWRELVIEVGECPLAHRKDMIHRLHLALRDMDAEVEALMFETLWHIEPQPDYVPGNGYKPCEPHDPICQPIPYVLLRKD